jgi:hypothetical protein
MTAVSAVLAQSSRSAVEPRRRVRGIHADSRDRLYMNCSNELRRL